MTENIIHTSKGVRYDLGYLHQTLINGRIRIVIIPNFSMNPPFTYPMRKGALNRFHSEADRALAEKRLLPKEGKNTFHL